MKKHDNLKCRGVICASDDTPDWEKNVVWYPGEPLCNKSPFTHWQKIQRRIQKLFLAKKLKFPYTYYTAQTLNRKHAVTKSTKGGNPNIRTWVR